MTCGGCNAGDMRHLIELQSRSGVQDGTGEEIESYSTYTTPWASVRPMQGNELENAQQISGVATHKIRIRYYAGVKVEDRILFDSRTFEIVHVLNFQERNIYQDILAHEVVE